MKTISEKPNRNKKCLAERISIIAIGLVALLIATSQIALGQSPRIPTPGADGNFGDIQVDGDRVKLQRKEIKRTDNLFYNVKIHIKLEADSPGWKMIRIFTRDGTAYSLEQEKGRYRLTVGHSNFPFRPVVDKTSPRNNETFIDAETSNFNDTFRVEFWKAKILGVHTHIATEIYRTEDFDGWQTTFNWRDGLEVGYSDQYEDPTAPINESLAINGSAVIIVSSTGGAAGQATIKFNTDVAWWTGVKVFERTGKAWLIEKVEGKYNPAHRTIRLPISSLPKEVKLEFWTARALGVHTHMATRKVIRERFDGRVVTINWGPPPATAINETVKIEGKNATIVSSNTGRSGFVTIKFQTGLAWWTAIKFFDRAGKAKLITKANGKYSPSNSALTVPIGSLPGNTKFEFWTAKAFGVHTHMTSRSFASERLDGRTITINWPK